MPALLVQLLVTTLEPWVLDIFIWASGTSYPAIYDCDSTASCQLSEVKHVPAQPLSGFMGAFWEGGRVAREHE